MKKVLLYSCLFFLFSCVEKIDFQVDEPEELVVVDGIFSVDGEHNIIRLSKTLQLNSVVYKPIKSALVSVENDKGEKIIFQEIEEGVYMSNEIGNVDNMYRLHAELPDGNILTSNYQAVPEMFPISDIMFIDTMATFLSEDGSTKRQRSLEFFAQAKNQSVEKDLFLRFQSETVFQVLETTCGPFHVPKRCFFYNDERPFDINLFEINKNSSSVEFETLVLRRKIDYRLAELFALDLRLLSYNKDEFEYWEKLKKLFDQDGNITDVNPARLGGNINSDDGSEVLGQFAVVGRSREIKIIGNADFSTQKLPFCGVAGNRPFPLPEACCNCLLLDGATVLKPDYWP